MKVTYDPAVDVLRNVLSGAAIEESDESKPGVILDYDKTGNVVGMEILDASRRTDNPQTMEYVIAVPKNVGSAGAVVRERPTARYGNSNARSRKQQNRKLPEAIPRPARTRVSDRLRSDVRVQKGDTR